MVCVDDQPPAVYDVAELHDGGEHSQQLPVKGGVASLGVAEASGEEGQGLETSSMMLVKDAGDGNVGSIGGDG